MGRCLPGVQCVQVLTHGDEVLVHALTGPRSEPVSELHRLVANGAHLLRGFDRAYLFSIDIDGRLLARDTTREARGRADRIPGPDGGDVWVGVLGHFDCFNHSIRVDHARGLFFLRGSPSTSHSSLATACTIHIPERESGGSSIAVSGADGFPGASNGLSHRWRSPPYRRWAQSSWPRSTADSRRSTTARERCSRAYSSPRERQWRRCAWLRKAAASPWEPTTAGCCSSSYVEAASKASIFSVPHPCGFSHQVR